MNLNFVHVFPFLPEKNKRHKVDNDNGLCNEIKTNVVHNRS